MGTGIGLFLGWENGIGVTGTGIWPLGMGNEVLKNGNGIETTFTLLRIGLKTAQKSNKTAFRLHSTGADLFENVTFAVATRPRFLNVVERKRSATRRCVNTNAVTFWYHL